MDVAGRIAAVLDLAEAEGGKVVSIQAVREALTAIDLNGPGRAPLNVYMRQHLRQAGNLRRRADGVVVIDAGGLAAQVANQSAVQVLVRCGFLEETTAGFRRTDTGRAALDAAGGTT